MEKPLVRRGSRHNLANDQGEYLVPLDSPSSSSKPSDHLMPTTWDAAEARGGAAPRHAHATSKAAAPPFPTPALPSPSKSHARGWKGDGGGGLLLVFGALFLVQLINASYNVMAQGMLEAAPTDPLVFSLLRDVLSYPLMQALALAEPPGPGRRRSQTLLPALEDCPRVFLQGLVGVVFNQVLILHGIRLTDSTIAGILTQMVPVFTALGALVTGLERPRWRTSAGLLLATGGAVMLVDPSDVKGAGAAAAAGGARTDLRGVGVLLAWCMCMAVYYIIQTPSWLRRSPQMHTPVLLTGMAAATGARALDTMRRSLIVRGADLAPPRGGGWTVRCQRPSLAKYSPLSVTAWEYLTAVGVLAVPALLGGGGGNGGGGSRYAARPQRHAAPRHATVPRRVAEDEPVAAAAAVRRRVPPFPHGPAAARGGACPRAAAGRGEGGRAGGSGPGARARGADSAVSGAAAAGAAAATMQRGREARRLPPATPPLAHDGPRGGSSGGGGRWRLSGRTWAVLIYCVLFNSVAKYPLSAMCNKRISVTTLTCWSTLTPVLTAALAIVFLGEPLRARYLWSAPIVAGTYLISTRGADEGATGGHSHPHSTRGALLPVVGLGPKQRHNGLGGHDW